MIIIIGPDNVGKTTTVKEIKRQLPEITFLSIHLSAVYFTPNESIKYSTKLFSRIFETYKFILSNYSDTSIILDRSYHDEIVYGTKRNYYAQANDFFNYVEDEILKRNDLLDKILLVLLIAEPKVLIQREDSESIFTSELDKSIELELFEYAYNMSLIKHKIKVDTTNITPKEVAKKIVDEYKRMKFLPILN